MALTIAHARGAVCSPPHSARRVSAFDYPARWMRGLAPGPANKTLEALRILFMFAALEGAAGLLLPRLLPWGGA